MPTLTIADYLKFANLQMAAEALYGFNAVTDGATLVPGELRPSSSLDSANLITGNLHASVFTPTEIALSKLTTDWIVVEHKSNTSTGFSGTLFKRIKSDPITGAQAGELVLSFRSTEFIDDAARDNEATNKLEISEKGFAFGQLADMETWYQSIKSQIGNASLSVTGYSLGGHLATAFNLMHEGAAKQIVTFNGAGVGRIGAANDLASMRTLLSQMVQRFTGLRSSSDLADVFVTDEAKGLYQSVKAQIALIGNPDIPSLASIKWSRAQLEDLIALGGEQAAYASVVRDDYGLLIEALDRAVAVYKEAVRAPTLASGGTEGILKPATIPHSSIAGETLDYQLAVIATARQYATSALSIPAGLSNTFIAKTMGAGSPLANQIDVVGTEMDAAIAASMVSNSQVHYGENAPIFIEDQPGYRGTAPLNSAITSFVNASVKLLAGGYASNDFGDTHSLVLLLDSLSVMNTLARIDPTLATKPGDMGMLFQAVTASKAQTQAGRQGIAEGDTLEAVVNALGRLLLGSNYTPLSLVGLNAGDMWWNIANREKFYQALSAISTELNSGPQPQRTIVSLTSFSAADLQSIASNPDALATRYALKELNPFAIIGDNSLYDKFNTGAKDHELDFYDTDTGKGLSDKWLEDRAKLLYWTIKFNQMDGRPVEATQVAEPEALIDMGSSRRLELTPNGGSYQRFKQTVFGTDGAETLTGDIFADHLYGAAGTDTLTGNAGDDYLEGGSGDDNLRGGAGLDTYRIDKYSGTDTLIDNADTGGDGRGSILYNGQPLSGTLTQDGTTRNLYHSAARPELLIRYIGAAGARGDLIIIDPTPGGSKMILQDWASGELGLSLEGSDATPVTPTPSTHEIIGDPLIHSASIAPGGEGADWRVTLTYNPQYQDNPDGSQTLIRYDVDYFRIDADGNPLEGGGPGRADTLAGTASNDHIVSGGEGDTITLTLGGSDTIDTGNGDDSVTKYGNGKLSIDLGADADHFYNYSSSGVVTLSAGAGRDYAAGGSEDDLLQGDQDGDVLTGGAGADRLFADSEISLDLAFTQGNSDTGSGQQGDWLTGGVGDDSLVGSSGNDVLSGGGGIDLLIGGAGDDDLLGDSDWVASQFDWSVTDRADGSRDFHPTTGNQFPVDGGSDVIYAGAGNDHVWAGIGDDIVTGDAGVDALYGEQGNDILVGGEGDDTIFGDGGNSPSDTVGDDYLVGGDGKDTLIGGGGSDVIMGGAGNDQLFGDSDGTPSAMQGSDTLDGGAGDDYLRGYAGADILTGGEGADTLQGEGGSDSLDGGDGNDTLVGMEGSDSLVGGTGDDVLTGGHGDGSSADGDTLDGGDGDDTLYGDAGNDALQGGIGADRLYAGAGANTLDGGEGNDILNSGGPGSTLFGGAGNDTLIAAGGGNTLDGGAGNDTLSATGGNNTLNAGDGTNTLIAEGGSNTLTAGSGNDTLSTRGGNSILNAGDGDNLLIAYEGRNTLISGTGSDTLSATGGLNYLAAGAGNDLLIAAGGSSTLLGQAGDDILQASGGNNLLDGGDGRDWYVFDAGFGTDRIADSGTGGNGGNGVQFNFSFAGSGIVIGLGSLKLTFANGDELHIDHFDPDDPLNTCSIDTFQFADRSLSLQEILDIGMDVVGTPEDDFIVGTGMNERINALAGDDTVFAGGGNDTIDAGDGNDYVDAGEGNDIVIGSDGNDSLDGGTGADLLAGGVGDDTYMVDDPADEVIELAAQGIDSVHSSITHTLAADLENLTLTGTADINATGNELDNTLTGNAGNNLLDGQAGADTLAAGAGDDTYRIDHAGDLVIEDLAAGTDSVHSTLATYTLTDHVENLSLTATANQDGAGNALDNTLTGNVWANALAGGAGNDTLLGLEGADTLDGGSGADLMDGGLGNDRYVVDDTGDQVTEALVGPTASGTQSVWTGPGTGWQLQPYTYTVADSADTVSASISYTLGENLENLTLTGTANLDGTGNTLNNLIAGNEGDNTLLGLDGYDSLDGGSGTDVLEGGAGDDTLDGGTGMDVMEGGLGNDSYTVDDVGDQVIETATLDTWGGQGWDVVNSSVSFTLADNVEVLILTGTDHIDGTGSAQDNRLIGNEGINLLAGGQGNDSYTVQTAGDTVIENADEGIDSVESAVDFTLGENVENLSLIDAAISGTGNALDNSIYGNSGENTLSGEGGNDILDGDDGNDLISGGAGDDAIRGGNDNGNSFYSDNRDTLEGGDGNDTIDGQSGNDTIYGGAGEDTLSGGDDGGDEEGAILSNDDFIDGGEGSDLIDGGTGADRLLGGTGDDIIHGGQASQEANYYDVDTETYAWGVASDDDTLEGGAGYDLLDGGNGNDVLDGGTQLDDLLGGEGDDTYVVDGRYLVVDAAPTLTDCGNPVPAQQLEWTVDAVTEYAGDGYDIVLSSAGYRLTDNVEELHLVFDPTTAATDPQFFADLMTYGQDGTGNDLDNVLIGNALANRLDGGAGADTLEGGAGNDTYVIDRLDTVVESADAGIDTVVTGFDYSLDGTDLENLTLLDGAMNGQGNAADNLLHGNAADNYLEGLDGNDKLIGGQGADRLLGGAGDDRYVFRLGDGVDLIDDWQGHDTLFIGNDVSAADIEAERVGDDLLLAIRGSTDAITVSRWFAQAEGLTRIEFCDGSPLDRAGIEALAVDMPPLATPIADQLAAQDAQFSFAVPADAFIDPNPGDTLNHEASMADGSALPAWLAFDAATQTFSGTPSNSDVGSLSLSVTATDSSGLDASSEFVLEVLNVNDAPTVLNPVGDQSVVAGQVFAFALPGGAVAASVLDDASDTGTPEVTWPTYDQEWWGSGGDDSYAFARGDGAVFIGDWDDSPLDSVQLTDVLPAELAVTEDQWGSVILSVAGTADSLTLSGWQSSDANKIEQVRFADGTVWGVSEILSRVPTLPTSGSDFILGTEGDDLVIASAGDDGVFGGRGNDRLLGGAGHDMLEGGAGGGGSDILSGGSGDDELEADDYRDEATNDLLAGGAGQDILYASISSDLLIGGAGDDDVEGDDGNDVMLFNRGDGNDRYRSDVSYNDLPLAARTDTVSLGGGIGYADLSFATDGAGNLILNAGNGESIAFSNWFDTSWHDNKAIRTLQVIADGMAEYDPNSADPLLSRRVQQFDFVGLADRFAADLAADPTIVEWQLAPHLNEFSLGASDTSAIGGDMAYLYGRNGNLDGLSEAELRAQLGAAAFGTANQFLTKTALASGGNAFDDVDFMHGDRLSYRATLADGSPLPAWLAFDAVSATFSGTPANGDAGVLRVAVTATDTGGLAATSIFSLEVIRLNTAPVAVADMITIGEDEGMVTVAVADLLANDIDPDAGDVLRLVGVDAVSRQGNAISRNAAGDLVVDFGDQFQALGAGALAEVSFGYTVADLAGEMSAASVAVVIAGANDAPVVANPIAGQQTDEDAPFSFTIPADSFTDIDQGDVLNYAATLADGAALPSWLSFDAATQSFSGTPLNGNVGSLNVRVTATDAGGLSATSAFALDVLNVNDAPLAANDAGSAIEDGGAVLLSSAVLLANDSDPDLIHGDLLTIAGVSQAVSGAAVSLANGAVQYDIGIRFQSLGAGQIATDSFSYTVTDGAGATSTATVDMTISGANDAPVATAAIADQAALEDAPFSFTMPADSFTDIDQGDVLNYAATLADGTALPSWLSFDAATQSFSGTPLNGNVGSLNVRVTATDAGGLSATSAFALDVLNVNDAPLAADDVGSAIEDGGAVTISTASLLANDSDPDLIHGDLLTIVGVSQAVSGAAVSLANGAVRYDIGTRFQSLGAGQTATDSFSYTVTDSAGATSTATVGMTVTGMNDGPLTAADSAAVSEDASLLATGNVLANDSDVDQGTVLSVVDAGVRQGNYGRLALNADGSYSYALDNTSAAVQGLRAGQTATESFAYRASDGLAATAGTLTVTLSGVNDGPSALGDTVATDEDTPLASLTVASLLANDSDADAGDVLALAGFDTTSALGNTVSLDPAAGNLVVAIGNRYQSLAAGETLTDSFNYSITDTAGATATAQVNVSIAGRNDAPLLVAPLADQTVAGGTAWRWQVPAGAFSDIDQGDTLSYSATLADGSALPSWLAFDALTRTFSGTAPTAAAALDVRVTAGDGHGPAAVAADTFRLTVSAASTGGQGCGNGNEGPGNGEDPPPPGHDYNHNDGPGSGPGHPGHQHGHGRNDRDQDHDRAEHDDRDQRGDRAEHDGRKDDKPGKCLDPRSVADYCERFGDPRAERREGSRDGVRAFAQWLAVDQAIARQASAANHGLPSLSRDKGADVSALAGIGKDSSLGKRGGVDPISLLAGGRDKQVFRGLNDGMRRFGG